MSDAIQQIPTQLASVMQDATLAPFLKPGMSVIIWTQDGSSVLWASDSAWPLVEEIAPDGAVADGNPLRDRLAVLAAGVAPRKGARLERLRFHSGPGAEIFTCACHALQLPSGGVALLTAIVGRIAQAAPPVKQEVPADDAPAPADPVAAPQSGSAEQDVSQIKASTDDVRPREHDEAAASPPEPASGPVPNGATARPAAPESQHSAGAVPTARLQEPGVRVQARLKSSGRQGQASGPFGSFLPPSPAPSQPPVATVAAPQASAPDRTPMPSVGDSVQARPEQGPEMATAAEPVPATPAPVPAPPPSSSAAPALKIDALSALRTLSERRPRWRFVWETDAEGRFTRMSDELAQAIGSSAADVVGATWFDLIGTRVRDEFGEASNGFVGDITWTAKNVMWRVSDSDLMVPVSLSAVPIHDADRVFQGYRGFGVVDLERPQPWGGRAARPGVQTPSEAERPAPAADKQPLPASQPSDDPAPPTTTAMPAEAGEQQATKPEPALAPTAPRIMGGLSGTVQARVGERPASPLLSRQPAQPVAANPPAPPAQAPSGEALNPQLRQDGAPADDNQRPLEPQPPAAQGLKDWAAASIARLGTNLAASATFKSAIQRATTSGTARPVAEPAATDAPTSAPAENQPTGVHTGSRGPDPALAPTPSADRVTEAAPPVTQVADTASAKMPESDAVAVPQEAMPAAVLTQVDATETEPSELGLSPAPTVVEKADGEREPEGQKAAEGTSADRPRLTEADRQALRDIARALGDKISASSVAPLPRAVDAPAAGSNEAAASSAPDQDKAAETSQIMLDGLDAAVQSGAPVHDQPFNASQAEKAAEPEAASETAAADMETSAPPPQAVFDDKSLRSILDRVPVPIIIGAGNATLYANRAFLELSGFREASQFDEQGGLGDRLTGMPGRRGPSRMIFRTRSNIEVPVETTAAPIEWLGQPATIVTLSPDVGREHSDKRKAAELDLRAQEARARELASMLDTATDGVVVIDEKGLILSLNRSAEALFGYDQANVAGEPFTLLLATESHPLALDYLEGLKANGVASILNDGRDVIGRVRQGGRIPLFMTMGRISDAPDRKFCAVLRDMSAWKKAEGELVEARRAAEKSNAQKSDFLAKISHEIRTPLNAIIGFAEVMLEERFGPIGNERYKEYLRDMHASGGLVISLINDLLDLAKIEAGRMEMDFASVDLNDVMASCVSLLQPQAGQSRVVLRTSLAPSLPPVVADERSLRQIGLNLLSNAVKFTDSGGQVIVSTALTDRGEVALRVRDTGIGMTDKEVKSALEPFRQISTTRRSGGTGLGLPLTKALVEANRGAFSITSAKGEGTLVEIVFPPTRVLAG